MLNTTDITRAGRVTWASRDHGSVVCAMAHGTIAHMAHAERPDPSIACRSHVNIQSARYLSLSYIIELLK